MHSQVGCCIASPVCVRVEALMKSAAIAVSPEGLKPTWSWGENTSMETALAADLITAWKFSFSFLGRSPSLRFGRAWDHFYKDMWNMTPCHWLFPRHNCVTCFTMVFHPHQRCGYSDSPFARIYFFYTAGSRNRFEGMERCADTRKNRKPYTKHIFLIEQCVEDCRQDEKHVPDLLESIIRPTDPVKEELRPILFKTNQFEPKSLK